MPATEMPTPRIAMSSGMPAATSEPSVMSSTMKATTTPTASVAEKPGMEVEKTFPP